MPLSLAETHLNVESSGESKSDKCCGRGFDGHIRGYSLLFWGSQCVLNLGIQRWQQKLLWFGVTGGECGDLALSSQGIQQAACVQSQSGLSDPAPRHCGKAAGPRSAASSPTSPEEDLCRWLALYLQRAGQQAGKAGRWAWGQPSPTRQSLSRSAVSSSEVRVWAQRRGDSGSDRAPEPSVVLAIPQPPLPVSVPCAEQIRPRDGLRGQLVRKAPPSLGDQHPAEIDGHPFENLESADTAGGEASGAPVTVGLRAHGQRVERGGARDRQAIRSPRQTSAPRTPGHLGGSSC
ncbi:uncharacterized protein LOC143680544 [Tamandua tetradactyla]|uniref:uncharacterized protein LOC143680544 n=1 Tax=Tamandua tetradactyla TaxID=48850 RepID=UPI0040541779